MGLIYDAKLDAFYLKWRKLNPHNETGVRCIFPTDRVKVGKGTYGEMYVLAYNRENILHIGNYVSVGSEVTFILSADHALNRVSTYPFRTKVISGEGEGLSRGDIVVEDDAWIGHGATILSGVHIGQGAVVAAGALVSKDVSPYTVAGGVPAKKIRDRFPPQVVEFLKTLDYSRLDSEMIKAHAKELEADLEQMSLPEIRKTLDWFPKKTVPEEPFDVTVLVLAYNPDMEKMKTTLRSVLNQQAVRCQIVIADDGSKDNHRTEIESFLAENGCGDHILVMNGENRGTVRNILSGLEKAEGKYTKLISPGDCLAHSCVLRDWIAHLEQSGKEWSFSDVVNYRIQDGREVIVREEARPRDIRPYQRSDEARQRWNYLALYDLPLGAAVLSTTKMIREECRRIAEGGVIYGEDNMWRVAMFEGKTCSYFPEAAVRYESDTGISTSGSGIWNERIQRDLESTNRIMAEMPQPDAFQRKALKGMKLEKTLPERVTLKGIWGYMLHRKICPRRTGG